MPEKLDKCVREVMAKGTAEKSAWAICRAATGLTKDGNEATIIENALRMVDIMNESDKKFALPETKDIQGVEIFASGQWNGDKYTNNDLDAIVQAFYETKDAIKPYLKLGHDKNQKLVQKDGMPALGWIESVRRVGSKLVADFKKLPQKIYDLMEAGAYRRVSSELYVDMKIGEKVYPYLLKAVSILGGDTPAVETLDDLVALYASGCKAATYEEKNTVKSYEYKNTEDESMGDTEKLQKDLAEAQKKFAEAEAKVKELEGLKKENEDLKKANGDLSSRVDGLETQQRAFADEKKANEINLILDKAIAEKKILPSQKAMLFALMSGTSGEKKFKVGDKEQTPNEILLSFIALNSVEMNTEVNTKAGDRESNEFADRVKKYSEEHKVTIAEATIAVGSAEKRDRTLTTV